MSDIITVNNTSYSVEEDWLKVASQFFSLDQNNEFAINLLKAGLFGYTNEIQSNEIKNAVYHRNIIYDEHFLNTAAFPESIYNFAKLYNYPVENAMPSHMKVSFSIKKRDLLENKFKKEIVDDTGTITNKRKVFELVLSNDYCFVIEQFSFMLPYPVQFILKETEAMDDYSITARYKYNDNEIEKYPFLDVRHDPYLKMWSENLDGETYIFVSLDLYQTKKTKTEYMVASDDVSDNLYFNIKYEDQIAFFKVYYNYAGVREPLATYFNNNYVPSLNEKACYYTYVDDDTLQISFSALPNSFRPKINSTLEVEIYSTKGHAGNFSYNGLMKVNFNNGNEFDKIPIQVMPITDSAGGRDKPNIIQIKNKIIEENLGRKNIITDLDLEMYFNNYNQSTTINGSMFSFVKKRNDVLKRNFNGYLLLRDLEGKVIPTNTAPKLILSKETFENPMGLAEEGFKKESSKGILLDGNYIMYNNANNIYSYLSGNENTLSMGDLKEYIVDTTESDQNIWINSKEQQIGYYIDKIDYKINCIFYNKENRLYCKKYKIVNGNQIEIISEGYENNNFYLLNNKYGDTMKITLDSNNKIILAKKQYQTSDKDDKNKLYYDFNNTNFKINREDVVNRNSNFILYCLPYILKVENDPIHKTRYYNTNVSTNYSLKVNKINSQIDTPFIINSLQIQKDNQFSRMYRFYLKLNTSLSYEELDDVKIRMIIYSKNGTNGFIDFIKADGNNYEYVANLQSENDIINNSELIQIYNSMYKLEGSHTTKDLIERAFLNSEIEIKLAVLYKSPYTNEKDNGDFQKMKDINDYACAVIYSSYDRIRIFKDLNLYMESDVIPRVIGKSFNKDETVLDPDYYEIKQVPLIEKDYFIYRNSQLFDLLDKYDDIVTEIIDRLENNDSIDIKMYNTFGPSYYWVTDTNGKVFKEENFDYVNNTSIPLELTIYTNKLITDSEDDAIKKYVSDFIEESNKDGLFAMSNLLRSMEMNFDYIRYIEFGEISYEKTQKIFNKFSSFLDMTEDEINDFVPEYLNICKKLHKATITDSNNQVINIGYDYKYDIKINYK